MEKYSWLRFCEWKSFGKNSGKNQQSQNSSSNKKSGYIRKYDESFIKHGFSFITQNGIEKPMCVVCGETLANSSTRLAPKVIFLRKSQVMTLTFLEIWIKVKKMTLNFFEGLLENTFFRFFLVSKRLFSYYCTLLTYFWTVWSLFWIKIT